MVTLHGLIESALMNTHHLANLTDAPEVDEARRHLIKANHATDRLTKMDHLDESRAELERARGEFPGFEEQIDEVLDEVKLAYDSV